MSEEPVESAQKQRRKPSEKALAILKEHAFAPGQSGNPGGTIKGTPKLRTRLKRLLRDHPDSANALVEALVLAGKSPDFPGFAAAQKLIWERHDGPVPTRAELDVNITYRKRYVDELEGGDSP